MKDLITDIVFSGKMLEDAELSFEGDHGYHYGVLSSIRRMLSGAEIPQSVAALGAVMPYAPFFISLAIVIVIYFVSAQLLGAFVLYPIIVGIFCVSVGAIASVA